MSHIIKQKTQVLKRFTPMSCDFRQKVRFFYALLSLCTQDVLKTDKMWVRTIFPHKSKLTVGLLGSGDETVQKYGRGLELTPKVKLLERSFTITSLY